jgi:ATP/maltotriose-dependent transcriptional regulator MalT
MNDSFTFISYLIEIFENKGNFEIQEFEKENQDFHFTSWKIIISNVINSVNDLQKYTRLILDDYYLIKNQKIHELVYALIVENLANFQVVIITRWDPPFDLRELRLYQKMLELRMRELRFEDQEISQLLSIAKSVKFNETEVKELSNKTEGWILAIRMILLAKSFSDNEYETKEDDLLTIDLDRLMLHIRENIDQIFFRQMQLCALLDQFDRELVEVISSHALPEFYQADDFLSKLIEMNFFLIPVRGEEGKFRFHHLIGDILKRQLEKTDLALVNSLYIKISEWFSNNDLADEAIHYSIKAKNYTLACNLITIYRGTLMDQGQWWVLQRWLNKIPRQIRNTNVDF